MSNLNIIKQIVEDIIENIDEIAKLKEKSNLDKGQLIAYVETLSIIQSAMGERDFKEIGLDFDVDKKFL